MPKAAALEDLQSTKLIKALEDLEASEDTSLDYGDLDALDQLEPFELMDPANPPLSDPVGTGPFRVGNRTPFPLRVVILLRSGGAILSPERAHWDFAPGEGAREGLLLSLGDEPLNLNIGDVVMAFTQDGTGRYWGPFMAGSTLFPDWDPEAGVWVLPFPPEDLPEDLLRNSPGTVGNLAAGLMPVGDGRVGPFRVGNRTTHPIRLIALLRGEHGQEPQVVHWDFAPEEGGAEGLPLGLGDELVWLRPGDVVAAFTIDGNRQYWGPSVVGESLLPFWDPTVGVWSTILQP